MGLFSRPKARLALKTTDLGEHAEAMVIARLIEVGYVVLVPFGNGQRYDLVIEDAEGHFWRIQCKKARYINGCVAFSTGSPYGPKGKTEKAWTRRGYIGQADFFAVYSKETSKIYFVPVEDTGTQMCKLRVEAVAGKGGPKDAIRWATDYEL